MKASFYSYIILSGLILLGCSKDRIGSTANGDTENSTFNYINDGGSSNPPKGSYAIGSISGTILPIDAKAKISIFSPKYFSTIFPAQDGSFGADNLREGIYSLMIESSVGYKDIVIPEILVKKDFKVDLGVIIMEKE